MDPIVILLLLVALAIGVALGWQIGRGRAGAIAEERSRTCDQLRTDRQGLREGDRRADVGWAGCRRGVMQGRVRRCEVGDEGAIASTTAGASVTSAASGTIG